jgi:hypothetical protein
MGEGEEHLMAAFLDKSLNAGSNARTLGADNWFD